MKFVLRICAARLVAGIRDIFTGSATGSAAEKLGRRWLAFVKDRALRR